MPVTTVQSKWDSGALVFHDADDYGAGAEILRISQSAVNVGTSTNDVTMTIYGDVDLYGDLDLADEDISVAVGKYIYLDGPTGNDYLTAATDGNVVLNGATTVKLAAGGTTEVEVDSTNVTLATNNIVLTAGALSVAATKYIYLDGASGNDYIRTSADNTVIVNANSALNLGIGGTVEVAVSSTAVVLATNNLTLTAGHISVAATKYIYLDGQSGTEYVRAVTDGNAMLNSATTTALGIAGTAVITVASATATFAQKIVQDDTTASSDTSTGSIQTDGGLGVAGAVFVGGAVTSSDTTSGFVATGAATQGLLVSGACTNGINITSTGTTFGFLYNVDMTTAIASNVEGIKVILERTADQVIGSSNVLGAEFIIKQGSDSYAAGMAPQITGVRIAMGGANTKATVYGLKCETQSSGFVNYMGMFSVNSGCTLHSAGAVLYVRSYVAVASELVRMEQIAANTAARGLYITDNVGTGTITDAIYFDCRNSTSVFRFATGTGPISIVADSMTANPQGDTEGGYITVYVGANAYQIPMYAA